MDFLVGLLVGSGLTLVVRGIMSEFAPVTGVEKPDTASAIHRKTWSQTMNFLHYDGTVMPEIKEDAYEH